MFFIAFILALLLETSPVDCGLDDPNAEENEANAMTVNEQDELEEGLLENDEDVPKFIEKKVKSA